MNPILLPLNKRLLILRKLRRRRMPRPRICPPSNHISRSWSNLRLKSALLHLLLQPLLIQMVLIFLQILILHSPLFYQAIRNSVRATALLPLDFLHFPIDSDIQFRDAVFVHVEGLSVAHDVLM